MMLTMDDASAILLRAWPMIVEECRAVLGSELHYQAVIYHCLRSIGVPRLQMGMNVKQMIHQPSSPLFIELTARRHEFFREGFEPIPDVVIFKPGIAGDWRRRNYAATLREMLLAIEVKASERDKGRLRTTETKRDVFKLAAHRDEVRARGGDMHPVVILIDTAVEAAERMRDQSLEEVISLSSDLQVSLFYVSRDKERVVPAPIS